MSHEAPAAPERRRHPRADLHILVQFRFDTLADFLAEYSQNISGGGMFLRSLEPRQVGSMVYLHFYLRQGARLIEGLGRVVRVQTKADPKLPPGMAIEFVNFEAESVTLIQEVVRARLASSRSKG